MLLRSTLSFCGRRRATTRVTACIRLPNAGLPRSFFDGSFSRLLGLQQRSPWFQTRGEFQSRQDEVAWLAENASESYRCASVWITETAERTQSAHKLSAHDLSNLGAEVAAIPSVLGALETQAQQELWKDPNSKFMQALAKGRYSVWARQGTQACFVGLCCNWPVSILLSLLMPGFAVAASTIPFGCGTLTGALAYLAFVSTTGSELGLNHRLGKFVKDRDVGHARLLEAVAAFQAAPLVPAPVSSDGFHLMSPAPSLGRVTIGSDAAAYPDSEPPFTASRRQSAVTAISIQCLVNSTLQSSIRAAETRALIAIAERRNAGYVGSIAGACISNLLFQGGF